MRCALPGILLLAAVAAQEPPASRPASAPASRAADARPNIVLLVADDLGYGELGGATDIPTPHLDSIARNGVRFTAGYVTCPVCAPTRAGLLSGRYGERFGFDQNPGPAASASPEFGLPREVPTLAERLRAAGYATGMFGKWHLGFREGLRPTERGFDEFFGFLAGAHPYLPNAQAARNNPIYRGTEPVAEPEYLTDALAREACGFIARKRDRPFFLYVPFNAVHAPMRGSPKLAERVARIADPKRRTFAAMLGSLDDAVGAIVAALEQQGLRDRTLVLFLSDNGGPTRVTTSRNGPLRGFKAQVLEGGVRVPMFVQWPGRLPAGAVYELPVLSLDFTATALAAAGIPLTPDLKLDGRDLLPFVTGAEKTAPHDVIYWRFGEQWAVRQGDWKLVGMAGEVQLFDLRSDLGESRNVAADQPERVKALRAEWEAWNAGNRKPRWGRGAEPGDEAAETKKEPIK